MPQDNKFQTGVDKKAGLYRFIDEQGRKCATAIGSRVHIEHERALKAKEEHPVELSKTEQVKAPVVRPASGEQSKS